MPYLFGEEQMAQELNDANVLTLAGHHLRVAVNPTLTGAVQLTYQDSQIHRTFTDDDVLLEETRLGTLATVTLSSTPDLGATTFTLVIPHVRVSLGENALVETIGITTMHSTSLVPALAHGQQETYTARRLTGSATFVVT
jgi:hypothetical protein